MPGGEGSENPMTEFRKHYKMGSGGDLNAARSAAEGARQRNKARGAARKAVRVQATGRNDTRIKVGMGRPHPNGKLAAGLQASKPKKSRKKKAG